MEKMEKKERKLNLKILIPVVIAVIVIAIIIIISIVANSSKELKLSEFEKIGIYGYLENDFLNVPDVSISFNQGIDDTQIKKDEQEKKINDFEDK